MKVGGVWFVVTSLEQCTMAVQQHKGASTDREQYVMEHAGSKGRPLVVTIVISNSPALVVGAFSSSYFRVRLNVLISKLP